MRTTSPKADKTSMKHLFARVSDAELLRQCLPLPLTPSWRRTLERRLEKGQVEDWGPRLEGAPGQAETPRPT